MFMHIQYSKQHNILSLILCGFNSVSKISKFPLAKIEEFDREAYLEINWRTSKKNSEAENNSQKQSEGNWRIHNTEDLEPGYPTVPRVRNSVGPMRHPLRSSSFHSHHQQPGALSTTATMADQTSRGERQEQSWKHNHPIENSHIVGVLTSSPPGANQDRRTTVASGCNGTIMCSKLNHSREAAVCRTLGPAASMQPRQESVDFSYPEPNSSSSIPVSEPSQETLSKDMPLKDTKERGDIPTTTHDDNVGEIEYPPTLLPLNKPLDIKVARVLSPSMFVCKVLSAWTPSLQEVMEKAQGTYNRYRKFLSFHLQLLPIVISESRIKY